MKSETTGWRSSEKKLYERGVKLRVISQPIDTSTSAGRLIFNILGTVAQFERELSWERTVHGLKSAKERGVVGGQPSDYSDAEIRAALKKAKGYPEKAAQIIGCKKITVLRRMKMWKEGKKLKLKVAA